MTTIDRSAVDALFDGRADQLHHKVDATRDAYCGFIFPVNRSDLTAVASALDIAPEVAHLIYQRGTSFSTFRRTDRTGQITNHIVGATLLALRGKDLDTGLGSVTTETIDGIVAEHEAAVLEIAEARSSWFGRIYFPAATFADAIRVFGGSVDGSSVHSLAQKYGFAAEAGNRSTVRGDFGIAVWLTLLAKAP
ncbi:hypothetical protein ACFYY8_05375 [Streptosporangium sp. NPDC001559]|uniref:hypothetical protein n=1 Tax=Streptosporangium sp. NPDC001559 TaxID=3366187 RepID=UPI0036ECD1EC